MAILGAGGVGKSCLTLRLTTKNFEEDYDPTIADLYETKLMVRGKKIDIDITDTAGQQEYMSVVDEWIQKSEGFLLVCSADSSSSVEQLYKLWNKIIIVKNDPSTPVVIANNKCDLKTQVVTAEQIEEMRSEFRNCPAFQTSAKTEVNVKECFTKLAELIVDRREKGAQAASAGKDDEPGACCTVM